MKYIDADLLRKELERRITDNTFGAKLELIDILAWLDSLQQEQQDFPTTDEQVKEFLAIHPKVEVPDKYKTPDWLFKKQEQQKVDLEEAYKEFCKDYPFPWSSQYVNREYIDELCLSVARHFYELGQSQMPMPEDTALFQKGVAEGRRLEREDSVECEVTDVGFNYLDLALFDAESLELKAGDKVKVIVLKEEEEEE